MRHFLRWIAVAVLFVSSEVRAHDVPVAVPPSTVYVQTPVMPAQPAAPTMVQVPLVPAPVVQIPIVQNSIGNGGGYRDLRYGRRDTIFGFGFRGLFSGALAGVGASYFVARDAREPARMVAFSTSIGAVSGAALGVALGVLDRMDFAGAYYISRDLSYGVLFGAATGAVAGGIAALRMDDAEAVLIGASAGSLTGVVLGLLTGVVEGQWRAHHDPAYYGGLRPSLSVGRLTQGIGAWGAQLSRSF